MKQATQIQLSERQLSEFYHDDFVVEQIDAFNQLVVQNSFLPLNVMDGIVDIGGGVGFFVSQLKIKFGIVNTKVIDNDPISVRHCNDTGIHAFLTDALCYDPVEEDTLGVFNMMLHHLVSDKEYETRLNQVSILLKWSKKNKYCFVTEYIYISWFNEISTQIIYIITKNKYLSYLVSLIRVIFPSVHANTLGVGVRFRSQEDWRSIFREAGFHVNSSVISCPDRLGFIHRILLIKKIYRMNFLLEPAN